MSSDFFIPDPEGQVPNAEGYFGAFGGKFIPEALVAAVDEVAVEYDKAKADPAFAAELDDLLVNYTGRPSPLTEVPRFAEHAGGARIFLKREDLNHTGSHKINNVLGPGPAHQAHGQDPRHRRDRRRPARRRHRHRLRALRPRVHHLHGRDRHPAPGAQRGPDAHARRRGHRREVRQPHPQGRHQRGVPRLGRQRRPHPLPLRHGRRARTPSRAMVRDFHRVIGVEARRQILERAGRLPDAAVACVGGGSNAIGLFHAFIPDAGRPPRRLRARRARRRDRRARGHADRRRAGHPARLALATSSRTRRARSPSRTRSRPASTTRASAPSTRTSRTPAAASTARSPTTRPCRRCGCCRAPRASSRRSRARTRWPAPWSSAGSWARTG